MPAHNRVGRDDFQMLAPAGAESASQDPEQLVSDAKPSTRSAARDRFACPDLTSYSSSLELHLTFIAAVRGRGSHSMSLGRLAGFDHGLSKSEAPPHETARSAGCGVRRFLVGACRASATRGLGYWHWSQHAARSRSSGSCLAVNGGKARVSGGGGQDADRRRRTGRPG